MEFLSESAFHLYPSFSGHGFARAGFCAGGAQFADLFPQDRIFTQALGFALGVCVHVSYCIVGIAAIVSQSILLFSFIKYIGAGYLIYIGCKSLRSRGFQKMTGTEIRRQSDIPWHRAIGMGFLTNILNPKATMFFFTLFTQVIDPHTPLAIQILYGVTAVAMNISWFSFVSFVLTAPARQSHCLKSSKWIDRACGGLIIAFGIRLAIGKSVHEAEPARTAAHKASSKRPGGRTPVQALPQAARAARC